MGADEDGALGAADVPDAPAGGGCQGACVMAPPGPCGVPWSDGTPPICGEPCTIGTLPGAGPMLPPKSGSSAFSGGNGNVGASSMRCQFQPPCCAERSLFMKMVEGLWSAHSCFSCACSTSIGLPQRPQKRAPTGISVLQALHWSVLMVLLPIKYF